MAKKNKKDSSFDWLTPFIFLVLFIALTYFAMNRLGIIGIFANNILSYFFGNFFIVCLLSLIFLCFYKCFLKKKHKLSFLFFIGLLLLNIAILLFQAIFHNDINTAELYQEYLKESSSYVLNKSSSFDYKAGIIGYGLYYLLTNLFDRLGTIILALIGVIISLLLLTPKSARDNFIENRRNEAAETKAYREKEKEENQKILKAKKEEIRAERSKESLEQQIERLQQQEDAQTQKRRRKGEKKLEKVRNSSTGMSMYDIKADTKPKVIIDETKELEITPVVTKKKKKSEIDANKPITPIASSSKKESKAEPVINDNSQVTSSVTTNQVKVNSSSGYHYPSINLLDKNPNTKKSDVNRTSAAIKGERIIEILKNFDIDAELVGTNIGPSVTKFEVRPNSTVKVSKILSIADNIKMELAAKDVRIEAPIPGKSAVGIEVPNVEPVPVYLRELIGNVPEKYNESPLLFVLGRDLFGEAVFCELDKMPHLLIAGATGSGKSVCINTIIMSLIMRNHPDDIKLALIDPKKVEFTPYHDIPHLLWPVITDAQMAANMLQRVVVMMEERYDAFAAVGVRKITDFNDYVLDYNQNKSEEEPEMQRMPYIVVIIDELADMMALAKKEVEVSIQRITQLARACGIHLIVATQRPSTDVITGTIKSNIPSRISFAVASSIDSRTILDQIGAERLLGNGDMLYFPQGVSAPTRLQGVYVHDNEIKAVCDYLKKQAKPNYDDSYFAMENATRGGGSFSGGSSNNDKDEMWDEIVEYITDAQKASTSLLQRRFGIGYNRAARLIDQLEEAGYIGPANGSKPREVYLKKEEEN